MSDKQNIDNDMESVKEECRARREPVYTTKDGVPLQFGPEVVATVFLDADERDLLIEDLQVQIASLKKALLIAEHGLTTSHGLMAYDDATPDGAKQHFRMDNTEELRAIKEAMAVKP